MWLGLAGAHAPARPQVGRDQTLGLNTCQVMVVVDIEPIHGGA